MKKFHFRLQKLLDLRTFREKEAETALGRAIAERDAISLQLAELAQKELTARMSLQRSSGTIADFAAHGNYLERLHLEREKQLTALTQAEIRIEEMRKHYIKAHQERLIVTKLKDKKQAYWKKDMQRQQDILLDDIINAQEYRKRIL